MCGLKQLEGYNLNDRITSHPAWGVWIETSITYDYKMKLKSHTPHGVCGLKQWREKALKSISSHTPHGVCGLKQAERHHLGGRAESHTPHGVCGLKHKRKIVIEVHRPSHPARGVWIETNLKL